MTRNTQPGVYWKILQGPSQSADLSPTERFTAWSQTERPTNKQVCLGLPFKDLCNLLDSMRSMDHTAVLIQVFLVHVC